MPHRHAHWFLLALFPLAGLAFWPSYLSQFSTASAEFHMHGVTATLWLLLLVAQSWTIHGGKRALHRGLRILSLLLFPLFLAGGVGIFIGMAQRFVDAASPFHTMYAARLAWLDVVAVAGFAYFYFEALRLRGKVHLHARYMLATVFFLLPPILGRMAPILPPLTPAGPEDFWKLGIGFQLANGITAAFAFALAVRSGKHGRPYFEAGMLTILAALLYQFVGGTAWWERLYAAAADLPWTPLALISALGGMLIGYLGWIAGRRRGAAPIAVPV